MAPQQSLLRRHLLTWLVATAPASLLAQTQRNPKPELAELRGATPSGEVLDLASLRGKVVLVFFWSTECPVCRNKMPELRANVAGWKGQNFTLLGVNMDAQQSAFLNYEEVVTPLLPAAHIFQSVWGLAPGYTDNLGPVQQLPSAVLIDKGGRVVERYRGRIPPQAWDRIADLL